VKIYKSTLTAFAAFAFSVISTHASAYVWTSDTNTSSSFEGVVNVTFDNPLAPLSSVVDYTVGVATYNQGAIYNASSPNITAAPSGSSGNFWSVGIFPSEQTGPGVVSFSTGVRYYGFLWGSSDWYNSVTFNLAGGDTASVTLTGSDVPSGTGDQSVARYLNFFAQGNEVITSVSFSSRDNAFETDNHAYSVTAVPEPQTYAMMLAGLGLIGSIARRRNKSKS